MPLSHERPSQKYMRELKAVARAAANLDDHLGKVNLLPNSFPMEQVEGFCRALTRLPHGTAEGSIEPLRAADSELNRVRQRFIPAHDEDEGDVEPLVPRNSDFDLRLVGLMAAVRAAIEQYKLESGEELDTDVTPDLPEMDKAKPAIEAAIEAAGNTAQEAANINAIIAEADEDTQIELKVENMLAIDAGVQAQSAQASLQTENPRPTVIGWLGDGLDKTAIALEQQLEKHGEKFKQAGLEVGEGVAELLEINFPKVAKSLKVVKSRLTNIVAIFKSESLDEPPQDFDNIEVHKYLQRGEMVPDRWAPFVTTLDLEPPYLSIEESREISRLRGRFSYVALLSNLKNLESLSMGFIGETDFSPISNILKLRKLSLTGTDIFDLTPLTSLAELESIVLRLTNVADVEPLAGLEKLVFLDLRNTKVTDLSVLSHLKDLEILGP